MNIEVVGRIRPSLKAEGAENLLIEGQRLAAHSRGPYLNFKTLHRQDASNLDLFRTSVDDLLDYYLAGFNVCLLVLGESGAGKSYTLTGEGTSKAGLVPMMYDALFTRLQAERYMADTRVKRQNPTVSMEMVEIYNELIKDLLQKGSQTSYLELGEQAEKGTFIKSCTSVQLRDSAQAAQQYRQGLSRRTEQSTDYGPAQRNAATLIHLDLKVIVGENKSPNKSRFTIVELPGLEKLSDDPNQLRQQEGPALSKALIALNQVVTSLSSTPCPDRVINYSDSKLTLLLKNELGGNCKTRGILCLKPTDDQNSLSAILNFSNRLTQVLNFPIVNDSYAQNLITQYQAKIIDLQQQLGVGPAPLAARMTNAGDVKETIRVLETENLRLKDTNQRLQERIDSMQHKFGTLATTKTDLSQELLVAEEEKLKMSQMFVDMQIDANKAREEHEATKFELTNKIIMLENSLLEAENERDRNIRLAKNARERLAEMEKDRKDLADEYVVLKTNYLALVKEHERETERNEELSIELLNLVNNKAALMKQLAILTKGDQGKAGEAEAEVDRVKAIVIQNSSGKLKVDEIMGSQKDRESVEQTLFANQKRYESEIDRLKREQVEESGKKDKKLGNLQKEFQDQRNLARDRQQKIAELNAALIVARNEKENLEMQRNRLQHKCKDLGEDFRLRLIKYIEDISDYVDKGSGVPDNKRDKRLKEYVDNMLKDIKMSFKEREDQLSQAAQGYREAKRYYAHKYEELLIAFRRLRLTAEAQGIESVDLGPDEHQLNLDDGEIKSGHLREINRLKAEMAEKSSELSALKKKYGLSDDFRDMNVYKPGEKPPESWAALRKQLREFTLNTQQQLEDERSKLLSENAVLKEELKESQDYIDRHLAKYKEEIVKLRRKLGLEGEGTLLMTDRSYKGKHRRH